MCGIAGLVSFEDDVNRRRDVVAAMTETMACRGPDAAGVWLDRHVALGHRRLAVIDIEGGAQPMRADTPDGPVVLTYSGETYNFPELREELRGRGHRFGTSSDTEVVLRAYLEWGEELVDRLNGMYAFAIWDGRAEKLVMVRDRMGIKPFYFQRTRDGVLFGSEPKAILAHPDVRPVIAADGVNELLGGIKTPGHAIWADMREVVPGTLVVVDRDGLRERTYWTLRTAEHTDDLDTTIATIRELLDDSVRRQLTADVPLGVLLSGGLDSSALTALSAGQLAARDERVRSYSVDFVGLAENFRPDDMRATPDSPFVHDVARHVGSVHRDIVLSDAALADPATRRTVLAAKDFSVGAADVDTSLYLLFQAIREHCTVALSGETADELFGGYPWFHDPVAQQAEIFPWMVPVFAAGEMSADEGGPAVSEFFDPDLDARIDLMTYLKDRYRDAAAEVEPLPGEDPHEARMRVMSHVHLTRFLRALLDRKDRISMAVGLEVRVPFCDHRLVEYVFNAPWAMKSFDGREKSLLRAATRDVLPESVLQRVKSPYPSTQDPGYAGKLQAMGREVLADPDHPMFQVIYRKWFDATVSTPPAELPGYEREKLDRALDIAAWLEQHRPEIRV
ncbi:MULTISPECIES: asparagine synthase (glutamine-hydrolyzing) [unclassified Saccharopolyspora]|uniref:asparagine synthase (glutamine-hydrolyzing) n=1 Tax=unclassified Saccharopolyspora TaxID=2646250 RepID=UPI001CD2EDEE|nr:MULTISPECIES: asparagine synthase (glutamine-hydrolyzing) [unclassified Saccharopolyspora]MCA1188719.1 asparagine synthase (glutamine-hydrolyzing) [Saccharopolyspora sp. 6T]MCA1192082.1 asparagine synthase (glutamine-hydrolyzing) [Saccharopolyspora sp. 6V]MCA1226110.1 asparagine synthase (glutamine-hydrolyzing) [Saccharopolyspora sp. 6M]MCA1280243.1 asparagine synthase (glutamine-hydrolyzing) [Saccharopolyspora sp. 7B]